MSQSQQQFELLSRYDDYLSSLGEKEDQERKHDHFHPSAFGGCLRKICIQAHNIPSPKTLEPRVRRIFHSGHAHHHRMQSHFADMGILRGWWKCKRCGTILGKDSKIGIFMPDNCDCVDKVPKNFPNKNVVGKELFEYNEIVLRNDEYNFEGRCDGIVDLDGDNEDERYVVDFKTINGDRFSYLKQADKEYITQINIYMWISGVKKGIIFYEDKNRSEIKEFLVKYDQNLIDEVCKSAKVLTKLIANGQIPKISKVYEKDKKPCTYCDFKDFCWKD